MNKWTQYLYERHPEAQLKDRATRLKMFRYFRAYSRHENDNDSLDVALSYQNTKDLIFIFNKLGIQPKSFKTKPRQPIVGKTYSQEEFSLFPELIENTQWIQQPGNCNIFNYPVFIWCNNNRLVTSTNPGSYDAYLMSMLYLQKNWNLD